MSAEKTKTDFPLFAIFAADIIRAELAFANRDKPEIYDLKTGIKSQIEAKIQKTLCRCFEVWQESQKNVSFPP